MARKVLPEQELVAVKYFTSRVTHQPESYARQSIYLDALERTTSVEIVEGEFKRSRVQCQATCSEYYPRPQEKRTDVNMAVHLVADAWEQSMDVAIVVSADADLVPAVSYIQARHGTRVVLVDPPKRHSDDLRKIADVHLHFGSNELSQSQLPNPVEYLNRRGKLRRIHRPDTWASN